GRVKANETAELDEKAAPKIAELPEENSPEAKNFRPPLPFKRVKPEYTATANLYRIEATIDILVDVDASGEILRMEIARWAGYGLDESVSETVRKMQWRGAERDGKFLPMRVLLRYNFRKIEDEE
ncbi:MAG TPA: TonB family protein, partial [Pyrinomonadaceae bacterium]|nr:TonB family protein [Pyrinomonadaceae bacterium]